MCVVIASLSSTEVAYFAAIATAIPVIWLGYLIALNKVLEPLSRTLGRALWRARFIPSRRRARRRLPDVAVRARWQSYALIAMTIIVVGVAVVVPAGGEFLALNALRNDHASPFEHAASFVGVITAGGVLVLPVLYAMARLVFAGYIEDSDLASAKPNNRPAQEEQLEGGPK